ncbi:hypothetical protein SpCBS45565_g05527 [Spizellomyces sp. 'palustris']|nr:hypothetical protein SpCBS45565_g05527 [Spizellomyces sp. 'palustris']
MEVKRTPVSFSSLPAELAEQIVTSLEAREDGVSASQVCRFWYRVLVPKIWRRIAPTQSETIRQIVINVVQRGIVLSPLMNFSSLFHLIREIDLSRMTIYNAEPKLNFEKLIMHCRKLESLNLTNCLWVTDTIVMQLINCTKLKRLNLQGCAQVTGDPMGLLLEHLDHLEDLSLAHCTMMRSLHPAFIVCRAPLRVLSLGGIYELSDMNDVLAAIFDNCHATIESLVIDWNSVLNENPFRRLDTLPTMNLRELNLIRCPRLGGGALARLARHSSNLRKLSLNGSSSLTGANIAGFVQSTPHLTYLDTSFIEDITDDELEDIATACPNLKIVKMLGIGTGITDWTLLSLSAHTTRLRELYMSMNMNITPQAVYSLVVACPNLTILSLLGCGQIMGSRIQQLALELDTTLSPENVHFEKTESANWRTRMIETLAAG